MAYRCRHIQSVGVLLVTSPLRMRVNYWRLVPLLSYLASGGSVGPNEPFVPEAGHIIIGNVHTAPSMGCGCRSSGVDAADRRM